MTQKTRTTKRLRELETEAGGRAGSIRTFMSTSEARLEGYKLALEDLAPVLAAAKGMLQIWEECPSCYEMMEMEHTLIEDGPCPIGVLRDALAAVEE